MASMAANCSSVRSSTCSSYVGDESLCRFRAGDEDATEDVQLMHTASSWRHTRATHSSLTMMTVYRGCGGGRAGRCSKRCACRACHSDRHIDAYASDHGITVDASNAERSISQDHRSNSLSLTLPCNLSESMTARLRTLSQTTISDYFWASKEQLLSQCLQSSLCPRHPIWSDLFEYCAWFRIVC